MKYELKTQLVYFDEIWLGHKNSYLILDGTGMKNGSLLTFKEYSHEKHQYTGREIEARVLSVKDMSLLYTGGATLLIFEVTWKCNLYV